jgi:hypothetical protein
MKRFGKNSIGPAARRARRGGSSFSQLHDVDGLSNPEIAETLHIKLGTIKSRAHRTRLFLRKRLADYMGGTCSIAQVTESALT